MKKLPVAGSIVVLLHATFASLYHLAHERIDLTWTFVGHWMVVVLFIAGPFLGIVLLSTPYQRQGAVVLLGSFLAALLSAGYLRIFEKTQHLDLQFQPTLWFIVYQGAFVLLLGTQLAGAWLGWKALLEVHAPESEPQS